MSRIALGSSLAVMLALSWPASADQVPGRPQRAPLITQGPGSDLRATVRDLRATDQRQSGVMILDVAPDGPARRAGLMAGDILTEFDKQPIIDRAQFSRLVPDTPPNRPVAIIFVRAGTTREAKITPVVATLP